MEHIQLEDYSKHPTEQVRVIQEVDDGFQDQPDLDGDYDPSGDKQDMYRLGKKQQLKRRFRYCRFYTQSHIHLQDQQNQLWRVYSVFNNQAA